MNESKDIVIEVQHLAKLYGLNKSEAVKLLEAGASKEEVQKKAGVSVGLWDINLKIPRGQIFVIIGLSGSGKSTLVRCFNLAQPRLTFPVGFCSTGRIFPRSPSGSCWTFAAPKSPWYSSPLA